MTSRFRPHRILVSADARTVAFAESTVRVQIRNYLDLSLRGEFDTVNDSRLDLSPDGELLVVCCYEKHWLVCYQTVSGLELWRQKVRSPGLVRFSDFGNEILCFTERGGVRYAAMDGKVLARIDGVTGTWPLCPGLEIAESRQDGIWIRSDSAEPLAQLYPPGSKLVAAACSGDKLVASVINHGTYVFDLSEGSGDLKRERVNLSPGSMLPKLQFVGQGFLAGVERSMDSRDFLLVEVSLSGLVTRTIQNLGAIGPFGCAFAMGGAAVVTIHGKVLDSLTGAVLLQAAIQ